MQNKLFKFTRSGLLLLVVFAMLLCMTGEPGNAWSAEEEQSSGTFRIPSFLLTITQAETPTAEPELTPTESPGETPTSTPEPETTPTELPDETPTSTPEPEPTDTPEPEATATPTESPGETPTSTPEPEPTDTPEPEPTSTPETTPTPTESPGETPTSTPEPTNTPEPEATSTPTPEATPDEYPNQNQGITLLDGFGGIHEIGDISGVYDLNENGLLDDPVTTMNLLPYITSQDVYRDIEVYISDNQIRAVVGALGDGRVFSAQLVETENGIWIDHNHIAGLGIDFKQNNVLRDVEFANGGEGYYAMLNDGSIYLVEGRNGVPQLVSDQLTDTNQDPAVDLEILEQDGTNISGYVLTAKGMIYSIGDAEPLPGFGANIPIFRDIELYNGGAVVADGFGEFETVVPIGSDMVLDIPLPELGFGIADALVNFEIQIDEMHADQFGGVGILAATKFGTIHTSGAADYFLTDEGIARRDGIEIVVGASGGRYINTSVPFDIIRDIEIHILNQNGQ